MAAPWGSKMGKMGGGPAYLCTDENDTGERKRFSGVWSSNRQEGMQVVVGLN